MKDSEPRPPDPARQVIAGLREQLDHLEQAIGPGVERLEAAEEQLRDWQRGGEGEHRLPVSIAVVAAMVLQVVLPTRLLIQPVWLLPALEVALFIGLVIPNPIRITRSSALLRLASLALIALITVANAYSAGLLVEDLLTGSAPTNPITLLGSGAAIYLTNIIVFGLWYWEADRGGPAARSRGEDPYPDFMFPQMVNPDLAPPDWRPTFLDYLYVSFTNAAAFSPTDVMPLARWAKAVMLVQASVSLITVALVVARVVNILK